VEIQIGMTPITATLIVVAIGTVGGVSIFIIASEFSSVDSDKCEFGSKTYKNLFGFEITRCYTKENTPFSLVFPPIKIVTFEWQYYGTIIESSNKIQGLIAEINKVKFSGDEYRVVFASGNRYYMDLIENKLEVGDIITINENVIERTPCTVKLIELSNGTTFFNDRELEYSFINKQYLLPDLEMEKLLYEFQWEWIMEERYARDVAPYTPHATCSSYTDYEFASLDSKIASETMEQIKGDMTQK